MNRFLLVGIALAASLAAQNSLGTWRNTGTTYATRGANGTANTSPAVVFTRIDKEFYAGWTTGATPGTRDIVGVNFVIQDNNLATQDTFSIVAYTEDPAMPNFPLVATPAGTTGNYAFPVGTGGGAYSATINFTTPLQLPATGDAFVGLSFNAGWTIVSGGVTDGLSTWEIRAAGTATQTFDASGPARPTTPPEQAAYSGFYCANPTTGPGYPVATMFKITPVTPVSGGTATALTNQANHVASTTAAVAGFDVQQPGAGTASMLTALTPDSASPSLNAGRADDIGQMYYDTLLPAGNLVFFLVDLGTFGLEIQLTNFLPGSTGVTCLNFATMQTVGFEFTTGASAFHISAFPPAARPIMAGIPWLQQAVGYDLTNNVAHAGPCTRQQM